MFRKSFILEDAPVAQLDRASASGAEGHRFESCRARQPLKALVSTERAFLLGFPARCAPLAAAHHWVRNGQKSPQNPRSEHQKLAEKLAPSSAGSHGPSRPVPRSLDLADLRRPGRPYRAQLERRAPRREPDSLRPASRAPCRVTINV